MRRAGKTSAKRGRSRITAEPYPMRALTSFLLLFLPLTSFAVSVPPGWHFPTASDRRGDWEGPDTSFHIHGDFNGDGVSDEAWILFRNGSRSWAVFVFLRAVDGSARTIRLTEERSAPAQQFVLETIRPSAIVFQTACGKGYVVCAKGEPLTIQFRLPSISVCSREYSCSVYVWQPKSARFQQIRMRD